MFFRTLISATALAMAAMATATAQEYPSRSITVVVPTPPGGSTDAIARTLAEEMGKRLGQTLVIDNKGGATGTLGVQAVVRAKPDGYTVLMTHAAPILNAPFVLEKVPYDVRRDLQLVTQVCSGSLLLAAHASVPANNIRELIAWAKQRRGTLSFGDFGIGSNAHLIGAYLSHAQDLGLSHVSYKGEAPMVQDVVAGVLPLGIGSAGAFAPHLASGRAKAIAVLGERRPAGFANVPTMAEEGFPEPEYKALAGMYLAVPAGTPVGVVERLEKASREALATPAMKARLLTYGLDAVGTTPEAARRDLEAALPVIQRLVKVSGARAE